MNKKGFKDAFANNAAAVIAATKAIQESTFSNLPGKGNGPADAYRHLLWSAELTRLRGEEFARLQLDKHEETGRRNGQTAESEAMDRHNNEIGISIGKNAKSWEEIVKKAREIIEQEKNNPDTKSWLPEKDWKGGPSASDRNWPQNGPPAWPQAPQSDAPEVTKRFPICRTKTSRISLFPLPTV